VKTEKRAGINLKYWVLGKVWGQTCGVCEGSHSKGKKNESPKRVRGRKDGVKGLVGGTRASGKPKTNAPDGEERPAKKPYSGKTHLEDGREEEKKK